MSDTLDRRLADVLALHFDPRTGSPYWLDRQRRLGFDVRREVRRVDDLPLLGPTAPADLTTRPLEDFVPRPLLERKEEWVVAETGGTLGRPTITLWLRRELAAAFVDPFTAVATACRFPVGAGWLFVGPTGPHVIGRAMRGNARALGSAEPFTVDFDPRWAKKLPAGSLAARRYLDHVVEQALAILKVQDVGVLFSTPPVLLALAAAQPAARRERIGGVFYGGLALEPQAAAELLESFPRAVHLAGYGNSLVGLALELAPSTDGHHDYKQVSTGEQVFFLCAVLLGLGMGPMQAASRTLVARVAPVVAAAGGAHHHGGVLVELVHAQRQEAHDLLVDRHLALHLGQRGGRGGDVHQRVMRLAVLADAVGQRLHAPVLDLSDGAAVAGDHGLVVLGQLLDLSVRCVLAHHEDMLVMRHECFGLSSRFPSRASAQSLLRTS